MKYSQDVVNKMLSLREQGMDYSQIAERTGATEAAVGYHVRHKLGKKAPLKCKKCGEKLPDGSRFCMMCGAKVLTEAEEVCEGLAIACGMLSGCIHADDVRDAIIRARKYIEAHA